MRRVMSVLSVTVGAVLLVLGTGAAALVGPDDQIDLRTITAPVGARAVVLPHDLVPLTGVTLAVTAHAEHGDVLVGAAHPVDVASYTAPMQRLVVLRAGLDGRLAGDVRGRPEEAPSDLGAARFWTVEDRGSGERTVRVPLDDASVAVVAVAAEPGSRLHVGVGVEVPSSFGVAVGAAALGAVLTGGGVALGRRRRGRDRTDGPGPDAASGEVHQEARPDTAADTAGAESIGARLTMLTTATLVGTVGLAGCAAVPGVAARPELPERPALTAAERAAPEPTPHPYTEAAAAAAAGDPTAWARVTSGPQLAVQEFDARVELARAARDGTQVDASTFPMTTLEEIAPAFTSYPLYRVVVSRREDDEAAVPLLRVEERQDVLDPWRIRAETDVESGTTLHGGGRGATHAPDTVDLDRAQAALDAVQRYLKAGDASGVEDLGDLEEVRLSLSSDEVVGTVVQSLVVAPWGDRAAPFGPAGGSRAVAVADGTVAVLTFDVGVTLSSTSADGLLQIADQAQAEVVGQPGWRSSFDLDYVLVVAADVSSAGAVVIRGADLSPVLR
ncbi:hypothetical protein [Cellulomonas biazotea]|uniref:Uncharacterized protein n=1 Tax=Cellulomonas biazotea TaxID=1709 RepID=A0A402DPK4_9CELL|nr:hypothetical protein [Cellulomonas biazotea]GCE76060.1 hypothetical protein CBZ_11160 [Cellulomonas biazotea]